MDDDSRRIGAEARRIRQRRGLSLATAAGLAGISKGQLSKLERGLSGFNKRGLIEDLAAALGCSPQDLTGMPPISLDRRVVVAASAIPALTAALHDTTLDDAPAVPTRPIDELVALANHANYEADEVRYDVISGDRLGRLLTELHVLAAQGAGDVPRRALEAIVTTCIVARSLACTLGHGDLAVTATRRGWDAANRIDRRDLAGLMAMGRVVSLNRVGARHRANVILGEAIQAAQEAPGFKRTDTRMAEAQGMLHLSAAHMAARSHDLTAVETHLDEARELARFTGESNWMFYHFGPTNVAAWELATAVETDRGPDVADRLAPTLNMRTLESADRRAAVKFDLARSWAQAGGSRDLQALQQLDEADHIAPVRLRQDPIAKELVISIDRRVKRRPWVLSSLRNRLGVA